MDIETRLKALESVPDDALQALSFSVPWQYNPYEGTYEDPDGFDSHLSPSGKTETHRTRTDLQQICWDKFSYNPQVNTAVRGLQGRLTGLGFETTSGILELQKVIDEIELDYRNRLYTFWPKYVGRAEVEGELFLLLTLHTNGFIEVDFIDPSTVQGGGDDDTGIIFHSSKTTMPLFYNIVRDVNDRMGMGTTFDEQVPSIYIARDPSLVEDARKHKDYLKKAQKASISRKKAYRKLNGYFRFVVSWDRGLITHRAVSHLKTVIEWCNYYEQLKKYEIDHKKSSGAYLWIFTITDARAFKLWLGLTDEERRKTGILAKKTPGGSLVLPPGMEVEVKNPSLSSIKEQDTDILDMVGSGLNEEESAMMGKSRSTYASAKASRGPMSDRVSDEIAWFGRFLQYDFWGSIFFLKTVMGKLPSYFNIEECIGYDSKRKKDGTYEHTPNWGTRRYIPEQLIDISFPISETLDYEGRARGMLGVKHGPISETLGVPVEDVSKRMGFGGYKRARLKKETEDRNFPKLAYSVDAESLQERMEGEPKKEGNKETKNE